MQLYVWRGKTTNFGDELNRLLLPALLQGFFDDDPAEIVLGIGSVLDCRHPPPALKIVLGAGYGGYQALPLLDLSWRIFWVRGPRTAAALGLPESLGLGDPAMLLTCAFPDCAKATRATAVVGFMPHFESLARGAWGAAARLAGLTLIDPRWPPERVLAAIGNCAMLVTEAMHGAVVADALRVPWVALRPQARAHRAKWQDWAGALELDLCFQPLPASCLYEWMASFSFAHRTPARQALRWLGPPEAVRNHAIDRRRLDAAAAALARAAASAPALSSEVSLHRCQDRMLTCLDAVRRQDWRQRQLFRPTIASSKAPASA